MSVYQSKWLLSHPNSKKFKKPNFFETLVYTASRAPLLTTVALYFVVFRTVLCNKTLNIFQWHRKVRETENFTFTLLYTAITSYDFQVESLNIHVSGINFVFFSDAKDIVDRLISQSFYLKINFMKFYWKRKRKNAIEETAWLMLLTWMPAGHYFSI